MHHFLIADDNQQVRRSFRGLLESQQHRCEEAQDIPEILRMVHKSQSNVEDANDFDLILMDFDFGDGTNGIQAINYLTKKFGEEYCEHRIIVITGATDRDLPGEFARLGAIGHLIKPVNETQFWASIDSALTRRELYVEKREDWESALRLLDNLGVLEGIEELSAYAQEYENLRTIHEQLLSDLQKAGGRDSQTATAYQYATESLNASPGNFQGIYSLLKNFGFTQKLISDVSS
jgi:CheY-like chemotaxis protein